MLSSSAAVGEALVVTDEAANLSAVTVRGLSIADSILE
jgi:hypothetical protein